MKMNLFGVMPLSTTQLMITAIASAARTEARIPSVDSRESLSSAFETAGPLTLWGSCPRPEWPLKSWEAMIVYLNCSRNLALSARSMLAATAA